jgi:hypothetical protein
LDTACSTNGGEEESIYDLEWESQKEGDHWEDQDVGGWVGGWVDNIKMDLREMGWDGMYWIDLAQDRDQWRAL